jgi:3-deoxy-manno-octulosonate cytidylyltransferase (CMP-KDO synthetase)
MPPSAIAVIPARYASSRFPGKPLANRTGKYLIQHVVERVRKARSISRCIVATDDSRIFEAVKSFNCPVAMTRFDHPNGTSRIAEVVTNLSPDESQIVVNVQGDEPEIEPSVIDSLVQSMLDDAALPMATVASPIRNPLDAANPNIVKVVLGVSGRALYFSRSLIPFDRDHTEPVTPLKHLGLYAYRRDFLLHYITLAPTPLERAEQLEQLRALEHGHSIAVILAASDHPGIDTPEQYEAFVRRVTGKA